MRWYVSYCLVVLIFCGCEISVPVKPVWLNEADTLFLPDVKLRFTTPDKGWEGFISGSIQPIRLQLTDTAKGFSAVMQKPTGIIEGPGYICLTWKQNHFYYPVYLRNSKHLSATFKDYRLPKTVNPDSSLKQQRMMHQIDTFRNITLLPDKQKYFYEDVISLSPKVGIYRAIAKESLSAYYILPGTVVEIPIDAQYDKSNNNYKISVGPLTDKYNNTVANGTLVIFIYTIENNTCRREVALMNGYANFYLKDIGKEITVQAYINNIKSKKITLKKN